MTKVAIKNENITPFSGIYHIMDVFSKLGFEKLSESVLGKRVGSGRHSVMEIFFVLFSFIAENMVFMPIQESRTLEIPHING